MVNAKVFIMVKFLSNIKDWIVKDNKGLHLCIAYILSDLLSIITTTTIATILVVVMIVITEVFDKFKLKTKFSKIDLFYGLLGVVLAFIRNKYLI